MKRHRTLPMDFDFRANALAIEIQDSWQDDVKALHRQNRETLLTQLQSQFGEDEFDAKLVNFRALGPKPFSIIAFHNRFLEQCRRAFVIGGYYPAPVGACALGERILNQTILVLRDDFRSSPEYKKVYTKSSFDDWEFATAVLDSWHVLLPEVVTDYNALAQRRHRAVHFDPVTDTNDRDLALEAVQLATRIIGVQFGLLGSQPWFIPGSRGESFIRKEAEQQPFVRRIYLPNCPLVGPFHQLDGASGSWLIVDHHEYEDREISDEEFLKLNRPGFSGEFIP
ncbi:MAG: hypothetical protein FJY88_06560 [Candidatus Eisenbacteria bacterium]|nr:hypothetical protein [Candidatus Eisenbacteria bacterium]